MDKMTIESLTRSFNKELDSNGDGFLDLVGLQLYFYSKVFFAPPYPCILPCSLKNGTIFLPLTDTLVKAFFSKGLMKGAYS